MDNKSANRNQICFFGLSICQNQSCNCKRSQRIEKFLQLLNRFTAAAKAADYKEQIPAVVAAVSTVSAQDSLS
jgi:hypothetical protein